LWWSKIFNENVYRATTKTVEKKHRIFNEKNIQKMIPQCVEKRKTSLENAEDLWGKAKEGFEKEGIKVFFAKSPEDAKKFIASRLEKNELIIKGKSLTTEEIRLRQFLEKEGHEVVETDLGEWIIQQRNELPSHFTAPAIHLSAEQISRMIKEKFKVKIKDDINELTDFIRKHLREKFLNATCGIIGANFVTATPPTIISVSNEGNVSLCARLPRKLFIVTGYDRIYNDTKGIEKIQKVLTSSATGQYYTSYIDFIKKPLPHQKIFLVILDNGRRKLLESEFKETARCIRCASCLNICPVYREVGGHLFGKIYHGGIGSLLTAFSGNMKDAEKIADLCLRCGSCEPECPMEIPIASLVANLSSNFELPIYLKLPLKMLKGANKHPETKRKNLIFIGCAFRTTLLKKAYKKIKSFAERLNADILEEGCCGMPHYYKGQLEESEKRIKNLERIFENYSTIFIPCSSGYSFLKEKFGDKVRLLSIELALRAESGITPEKGIYLYHLPCHLKHLKNFNEKNELKKVLKIKNWESEDRCCGSAGTFWLTHPFISRKILSRKKQNNDDLPLITSCPSCYIQLKRVFKNVKHTSEVFD